MTREALSRRANALYVSRELRGDLSDILLHLLAVLRHSGTAVTFRGLLAGRAQRRHSHGTVLFTSGRLSKARADQVVLAIVGELVARGLVAVHHVVALVGARLRSKHLGLTTVASLLRLRDLRATLLTLTGDAIHAVLLFDGALSDSNVTCHIFEVSVMILACGGMLAS